MASSSVLSGLHKDLRTARLHGLMDESVPAAIAWLGMDFGQSEAAFDLVTAREQAKKIVAVFFDGATFLRSTGLWRRTQNGGLTVMLYNPVFDGDPREESIKFFERARACAQFIRETFVQQAVALVAQFPNGETRVEFVESKSRTPDQKDLDPAIDPRMWKYALKARATARQARLTSKTVQESK